MLPTTRHDRQGREYTFRAYTPADRPALEAFYRDFEPKRTAQGLPPQGDEGIRRWLDGVLASGIHLLAWAADELVGHAFLVPLADGRAEYAVFLHQDVRGRGMGTELNQVAVEAAREAGLKRLWLTVEPRNRPAIRSYQKAGFRFVPETVFLPEAEMEMEL